MKLILEVVIDDEIYETLRNGSTHKMTFSKFWKIFEINYIGAVEQNVLFTNRFETVCVIDTSVPI